MTVGLDRIVDKIQDAYAVSRPVVETYVLGSMELHRSMPSHIRENAPFKEEPLDWMDRLYRAHDYIDGVLQPMVNGLHDTHADEQTPLRNVDRYRDASLQADYSTICETGAPANPGDARDKVNEAVERIRPVLKAEANTSNAHAIPLHIGDLSNQTFESFQEELEEDTAAEAKERSRVTEATDISKVKRGTLISPQHLYNHQVRGNGTLKKRKVQRRLANYLTMKLSHTDNTDEAYEWLRSNHSSETNPFTSYMFESFENIDGASPVDPAKSIDW
jgi:hypothetical protein